MTHRRNDTQTFVTLYENKPGQLDSDGSTIRATRNRDGSVDLIDSALTHTDGRVFGHGKLFKTAKSTPNYPDLRGTLQIPFESDYESDPGKWTVAAWWRFTVSGKRALRLCLMVPLTRARAAAPAESSEV